MRYNPLLEISKEDEMNNVAIETGRRKPRIPEFVRTQWFSDSEAQVRLVRSLQASIWTPGVFGTICFGVERAKNALQEGKITKEAFDNILLPTAKQIYQHCIEHNPQAPQSPEEAARARSLGIIE